jgi:hypothetical protein
VQDKLKKKTRIVNNVATNDFGNSDHCKNIFNVVSLTLLICTFALCDCISGSDNFSSTAVVSLCSDIYAVTLVSYSLNNILFNQPPGPWKTAFAEPRGRLTSELQPPRRQSPVPKYEATSSDDPQRNTAAAEPKARTTHLTSSEIKEKYLIRIIKMAVFIFRILYKKSGSQPCFEKVYSSVSVFCISYRDQDSTASTVWSSNISPVKLKGRG